MLVAVLMYMLQIANLQYSVNMTQYVATSLLLGNTARIGFG